MNVYQLPIGWRGEIQSIVTDSRTGVVSDCTYTATASVSFRYDAFGVLRRLFSDCFPLVNGEDSIWLGEPGIAQERETELRKIKPLQKARLLVESVE